MNSTKRAWKVVTKFLGKFFKLSFKLKDWNLFLYTLAALVMLLFLKEL